MKIELLKYYKPKILANTSMESSYSLNWDQLVKILPNDLNCRGMQYKEGLNIDVNTFQAKGLCAGKGLYFTTLRYMPHYLSYGTKIADVQLVDDLVYYEPLKAKAHKLFLSNIRDIRDHPCWKDEKFCEHAMRITERSNIFIEGTIKNKYGNDDIHMLLYNAEVYNVYMYTMDEFNSIESAEAQEYLKSKLLNYHNKPLTSQY